MTVAELMQLLSGYPPESQVYDIDGMSIVPPRDLTINAPCAAAVAAAPINNEIPEDLKEAGYGLD